MKTVVRRADVQTVVALQDGNLISGTVQDCTPIVDESARKRHEGELGSKDMRHAASFPAVVVERYCNESGISFSDFMADRAHIRRMLSDPALSYFRIWEGRV